jgi:hypothetical protein
MTYSSLANANSSSTCLCWFKNSRTKSNQEKTYNPSSAKSPVYSSFTATLVPCQIATRYFPCAHVRRTCDYNWSRMSDITTTSPNSYPAVLMKYTIIDSLRTYNSWGIQVAIHESCHQDPHQNQLPHISFFQNCSSWSLNSKSSKRKVTLEGWNELTVRTLVLVKISFEGSISYSGTSFRLLTCNDCFCCATSVMSEASSFSLNKYPSQKSVFAELWINHNALEAGLYRCMVHLPQTSTIHWFPMIFSWFSSWPPLAM